MGTLAVRAESVAIASWVTNANSHQSKTVFNLSNGNQLVLVRDRDVATTLYVYEVTTDRTVNVLRQTLTSPVSFREIVGATFVNNDLAVAVMATDGKTIRYCKVIYGTWSAVVWETASQVFAADGIRTMDISVSDTGAVALVYHWCNTYDMTSAVWVRRPAGGAWINSWSETLNTATSAVNRWVAGGDSCSVLWLDEQSAGVRHIAVVDAHARANGDQGVILKTCQITEATGARVALSEADVDVIGTGEASASLQGTLKGRLVNLYRISSNRFVLMAMHSTVNKKALVRIYQRGGSWIYGTLQSTVMPTTPVLMATSMRYPAVQSDVLGYGEFVFTYSADSGSQSRKVHSLVCKLILADPFAANNVDWSAQEIWGIPPHVNISRLMSMGDRNPSISKADVDVESYATAVATYNAYNGIFFAQIPTNNTGGNPITQVQPLDGSTVPTATPILWAKLEVSDDKQQGMYKVQWQIAKDAAFTVSLAEKTTGWNDLPVGMPHSLGISTNPPLTGNPWFIRARLVDSFGNLGAWTPTNQFIQGHPPVAVGPFSPLGYVVYGTGNIYIDWEFSDTFVGDSQTAYQVRIWDATTATMLYDTGKVASTQTRHLQAFVVGDKEKDLYFEVKLWDTEDNSLNFSQAVFFALSDAPIVNLTYPASGAVLSTGVPTITATLDSANSRPLKEYAVTVTQAGAVVWFDRTVESVPDGFVVSKKIPSGILQDGQSYTAQVTTVDTVGLQGSSSLVTFTVDWVPPLQASGVEVDVTHYNVPDEAYVLVEWADTNREVANFQSWNVWRRTDLRNPDTDAILEVGIPELVHTEYSINTAYEYKDYYAPSGYSVKYWVTQIVDRDGQEIDSGLVGPGVEGVPMTDGYWLITPAMDEGDASAFKLSVVTGDSFVDEEEEAELVVIGVGRTYQKGEKLGAKGALDCQLRNTDGTTARQKRLRLKNAQDQETELWLRNPFGDLFRVNVSQISASRIAGVGIAEFCDVSIPYAKVGR